MIYSIKICKLFQQNMTDIKFLKIEYNNIQQYTINDYFPLDNGVYEFDEDTDDFEDDPDDMAENQRDQPDKPFSPTLPQTTNIPFNAIIMDNKKINNKIIRRINDINTPTPNNKINPKPTWRGDPNDHSSWARYH